MSRMRYVCGVLTLGAVLSVVGSVSAEGPSTISILSPHNGDKVQETFDIKYEILNAPKGNHAHVYLDGAYQKGFKGTFTHVPKGEHTVTVKIADHDHHDADSASDSIKITVGE